MAKFIKRPVEVDAVKDAGGWQVTYNDGRIEVYNDSDFRRTFKPGGTAAEHELKRVIEGKKPKKAKKEPVVESETRTDSNSVTFDYEDTTKSQGGDVTEDPKE